MGSRLPAPYHVPVREKQGDGSRQRWNRRYRDDGASSAPSTFVTEVEPHLPPSGLALDVAGGAGRHALWLARRGLDVTLVDVSDEAVALARRRAAAERLELEAGRLDLEADPLPRGPWDVILVIHYLQRDLFPALREALAPGGIMAVAIATIRNLERHERPPAAYLLAEGEAPRLVDGLDIVSYTEGWGDEGRHEARLVARRPP